MERALATWASEAGTHGNHEDHGKPHLRLPYTIYGCMLLLSHSAFQSETWKTILADSSADQVQRLYALLIQHLKITHIAISRPIPLTNTKNDCENENIIRAPSNFEPLCGDFGPSAANFPPTAEDFNAAFWVTAKQNGVYQTWAPRWTMFSRGNISEKARVLELESVAQAVQEGRESGRGCAAVDLYAGIGYFTFSYLKAGVRRVLCWDLSAWSCEGLRRGAGSNGWEISPGGNEGQDESEARIVVFNESNESAAARVQEMRAEGTLEPVRHVNCGLLPTSRASWRTAAEVLNPEMGGWVHVHENFAVAEIEQKAEEVRLAFQEMIDGKRESAVELEFVNRLKSYAPGVIHCVLDLYIPRRIPD